MIVAEAELAGAAQHAVAAEAENRLGLDGASVGHGGARRGERDDVAGMHVEGTAPHVPLDPVAGIDEDPMHLRRAGMALGAQHAGGDDTGDGTADTGNVFHREAEVGDELGDGIHIVAHGREVVEPGMNDLHWWPLRTAR